MPKDINMFQTHDVDLAAFLMLEGLKFVESVLDTSYTQGKPRVVMRFIDDKNVARDLERAFMSSQIKRFTDFRRYLLKDVHRTLNGIK